MSGSEAVPYDAAELWRFLPLGYVLTVLLEMPVLLVGLSPRHSWGRKIFAGFWLTACTYPIVVLVLPLLLQERFGHATYLATAETFAPLAECLLFYFAYHTAPAPAASPLTRTDLIRDMVTIIGANLVSFLVGAWLLRFL
jgi:hypothetical protein